MELQQRHSGGHAIARQQFHIATSEDLEQYIDLAAAKLGGAVILANDEFFAPKEALLNAGEAVWKENVYTERGKWMDGWETRRRRTPGYDWCIIRLGLPGFVRLLVVDTAFFRGNYPESCSVEGAVLDTNRDLATAQDAEWFELLPRSPLQGDTKNLFEISGEQRVTHLRLNIFPDGGVARLRAYGVVLPNRNALIKRGEADLAAVENGAVVISCSDMFFGHRQNLIMPGRSTHMADGWETRRRRGSGHDWTIIRLGGRGTLHRIEIDTDHFKGNAPDSCDLELFDASFEEGSALRADAEWTTAMPLTKLQPHTRHTFELANVGPATHARLNIYPDGGIARLRLFGMLQS